jgi:hypothetical protein
MNTVIQSGFSNPMRFDTISGTQSRQKPKLGSSAVNLEECFSFVFERGGG